MDTTTSVNSYVQKCKCMDMQKFEHVKIQKHVYPPNPLDDDMHSTVLPRLPSPPLMHHMQGVELEVVVFIEPSADKVIEPEAGPSGKR